MSGVVAAAFANRFTSANYTPTASLTTPTYDASGQTTEPTWRKKPTWATGVTATDILAHNPLTGGSSAVENPSLLISNDNGATWAAIASGPDPVFPTPTTGNNQDCYIWDDSVRGNNTLYFFWQSSETGAAGIYYATCTDPNLVTWSARTRLNTTSPGLTNEPKVLWDPVKSRYIMYLQDFAAHPYFIKYQTATTIAGLTSTTWTPISLTVPQWGGYSSEPWHMDVIRETSGRWVMAFSTGNSVGPGTMYGWLASSWDGINWKSAPRPLLRPNSWANGIYRPSIQPARTGGGYDFIVARTQAPSPQLGLVRNVPATEIP